MLVYLLINDIQNAILSRSNNEDTDNTSVFDQLGQTEIADIFYYIFKKFNLIKIFSHIKPYRSKQDFTSDNIIACILAGAFGCSLNKMFEISDLNLHELRTTPSTNLSSCNQP